VNDNIVAFWRPKDPLRSKTEYLRNYRLRWCWLLSTEKSLARVVATRCGLAWNGTNRQFVIDFVSEPLRKSEAPTPPALDHGSSKGQVVNATVQHVPDFGGWRVSLELDPKGEKLIDLHARLMDKDKPLSETWIYRWTPT
jgi:glucans biosynthesis protein